MFLFSIFCWRVTNLSLCNFNILGEIEAPPTVLVAAATVLKGSLATFGAGLLILCPSNNSCKFALPDYLSLLDSSIKNCDILPNI